MNSAEEFEQVYLKEKFKKLSNDLKAATDLLQAYRDTFGYLRHHKIEQAEFEYEKAINLERKKTTLPTNVERHL